jgi:Spy/CpxP family protein refolding chaperone
MSTRRRITLIASAAVAFAALVAAADAQPYGPGTMMGPGMMGPGMMGRGGFGLMCSPAAAGFAEWRIDRLEQVIKPTDAQRAKFDEIKTASNKAADIMRSACPTEFPKSAVARMEVMEKHADAMLQAIKTVRPAMEAFYATLSDEQKTKLDSNTGRGRFWHWRDDSR